MMKKSTMNFSKLKLSLCLLLLVCVNGIVSGDNELSYNYYDQRCRFAMSTIKTAVFLAILREPRMGASLLRLHFHDCFVQGCDASILLDDTATFTGEKTAFPNINSARGYEVIDAIKSSLEAICPGVVSCADILTVAARDSVVILGGQSWPVKLGRKDSTTASLSEANTVLPSPSLNLDGLVSAFAKKGFTPKEMVALSGAHTIGQARCATFKSRVYNENNINSSFASMLKARCPISGGDNNLSPLDASTPNFFDTSYFKNLVNKMGLLHSDQQLFNGGFADSIVQNYIKFPTTFLNDFANAMIKMGDLSPPSGSNGQIRRNCRRFN